MRRLAAVAGVPADVYTDPEFTVQHDRARPIHCS
jgi:hypothetical protein